MEKYGVENAQTLKRVELVGVRQRLGEIRRGGLEKSAAADEYKRLTEREGELVRDLADQ